MYKRERKLTILRYSQLKRHIYVKSLTDARKKLKAEIFAPALYYSSLASGKVVYRRKFQFTNGPRNDTVELKIKKTLLQNVCYKIRTLS